MDWWATIIGFLGTVFSTVFPFLTKEKEVSVWKQDYDKLRRAAAEALTKNACYYLNPFDISKNNNQLLPKYAEGTDELRSIGAKFIALAETLSGDIKDIPLTRKQIDEVGHYFIGLSNSFCTPYMQPASYEDIRNSRELETQIRQLLNIPKLEG